MKRFGEKLRNLRKYHKVTLQRLAASLDYSTHSYISEIESGRKIPTVQFVLKVSRLFNISTDALLKDELDLHIEDSRIEDIS